MQTRRLRNLGGAFFILTSPPSALLFLCGGEFLLSWFEDDSNSLIEIRRTTRILPTALERNPTILSRFGLAPAGTEQTFAESSGRRVDGRLPVRAIV